MSPLIVQKYGGTSVAKIERLMNVAQHIKRSVETTGNKAVVVVSAMGTYTDDLLVMATALDPMPPRRELDMLLTAGERISSSLLAIALHRLGVPALSLTGSQCGILTDEVHGNARIKKILGDRIRNGFQQHQVVIIAGFQGVSPVTRDVTTLGRGGSDLTAVALAIALEARECQIYTDVPGVMSADPRKVPKARPLSFLSWGMMTQLAHAGAGVMHHRGAFLAQKFKMPVVILNSQTPELGGTRVEGNQMESAQILAVTSKASQVLLQYELTMNSTSAISKGLQWLWKHEGMPALFRVENRDSRSFVETVLGESLLAPFLDFQTSVVLEDGGQLNVTLCLKQMATLSIVGSGFRQAPEILDKLWSVLPEAPVLFEVQDTSINLLVHGDKEEQYLNLVHDTL
ncbi:MAG: aspartate kinase [Deltaproteobacteria bacterium]|nr:aspartate kinase [Deltaproteobacteria bacterium]